MHLTVQYATQKDALLNSYKYMFQKQGDKATGKLLSGFKENKFSSLTFGQALTIIHRS